MERINENRVISDRKSLCKTMIDRIRECVLSSIEIAISEGKVEGKGYNPWTENQDGVGWIFNELHTVQVSYNKYYKTNISIDYEVDSVSILQENIESLEDF